MDSYQYFNSSLFCSTDLPWLIVTCITGIIIVISHILLIFILTLDFGAIISKVLSFKQELNIVA
jgi:hypothetical protein